MSKKIIALLFVAIMLPAVLFGCLDDEEPEETEPKVDMSFNFNELAAKAIQNAPENGEVALDLRNSNRNLLHRIVFEAWNERPDVTVYLGFLSHHHLQKAIIPAGTDLSVIPGQKHSVGVGSILEALGIEAEPVTEEDLAYYKAMITNQKAAATSDASQG